jgi:hypothetical protein
MFYINMLFYKMTASRHSREVRTTLESGLAGVFAGVAAHSIYHASVAGGCYFQIALCRKKARSDP